LQHQCIQHPGGLPHLGQRHRCPTAPCMSCSENKSVTKIGFSVHVCHV
jgi:hypothetical protein